MKNITEIEELKKDFFKCFGIKRKTEITDRHYLNLLSLLRKQDTDQLKVYLLSNCIFDGTYLKQPYRKNFIETVKALFKERI